MYLLVVKGRKLDFLWNSKGLTDEPRNLSPVFQPR